MADVEELSEMELALLLPNANPNPRPALLESLCRWVELVLDRFEKLSIEGRGMEGSERLASIDPSASSTSGYELRDDEDDEERRDEQDAELRNDCSESSEGRDEYDSNGGEGRGSHGGASCDDFGRGAGALTGGLARRIVSGVPCGRVASVVGGDRFGRLSIEADFGNTILPSNGENWSSSNAGRLPCLFTPCTGSETVMIGAETDAVGGKFVCDSPNAPSSSLVRSRLGA